MQASFLPRAMPTPVADAFDAFPKEAQPTLMAARDLIFQVAASLPQIGPLKEALRWGEPAYLTSPGIGSTVRLGWKKQNPDECAIYFICRTNLIDRFRTEFGDSLKFEGDRAIRLKLNAQLPMAALKTCIGMALTYNLERGKKPT